MADVIKKLPDELRELAATEDPEWLISVLTEAESWLRARLLESESVT